MSRHRGSIALACLGVTVLAGPAAVAETLEAALRTCAAEPNDMQRLACYDRAVSSRLKTQAAAGAATAAATAAAAPASATTTASAAAPAPSASQAGSGVSEFGVRNGPLDPGRNAPPAGPRDISAAVSGIGQRASGVLVISLDNGQTWVQNQPSGYFPLKVGDTVQIRAAALGSYMLLAPSKRVTRVTRIR